MKNLIFIISAVLIVACGSVLSQGNSKLDSIFKYHFAVLDSVIQGTKNQHQLTAKQSSFLYLISSWVNDNTSFNHFEGIKFGREDLEAWELWYSKNSSRIDPNDFYKGMDIYHTFFSKGFVPDGELDYLENLDKKYSAL